jgi:hypothetical protein
MQTEVQIERAEAIEKHLCWFRKAEARPWNERAPWSPCGPMSDKEIEDINWGLTSSTLNSAQHDPTPNPIFWDEIGFKAFKGAIESEYQFIEGKNASRSLSHVELDVQGLDAKGYRARVQRSLEVKLKITNQTSEEGNIETTTMTLKRVLRVSSPDEFCLPPTKPNGREVYHDLLGQLAQHEVNKALDERNHYLRGVFGQDVDHVRKRRDSTILAHEWTFRQPEIYIRGPDGTLMSLREKRRDYGIDDKVLLTHTLLLEQVRGEEGKSHLFDLPIEGCESERRVRQARWSISSAIDRCIASGCAERFVLDRWVGGTFLPRD